MSSSVPYPWDKKTVIQHKITLVLKKKTKKLFSNFQVTCITLLLIEIHKLECQTVEKKFACHSCQFKGIIRCHADNVTLITTKNPANDIVIPIISQPMDNQTTRRKSQR